MRELTSSKGVLLIGNPSPPYSHQTLLLKATSLFMAWQIAVVTALNRNQTFEHKPALNTEFWN